MRNTDKKDRLNQVKNGVLKYSNLYVINIPIVDMFISCGDFYVSAVVKKK